MITSDSGSVSPGSNPDPAAPEIPSMRYHGDGHVSSPGPRDVPIQTADQDQRIASLSKVEPALRTSAGATSRSTTSGRRRLAYALLRRFRRRQGRPLGMLLDEEDEVILSRRIEAMEEALEAACSEIAALGVSDERVVGIDLTGGRARCWRRCCSGGARRCATRPERLL